MVDLKPHTFFIHSLVDLRIISTFWLLWPVLLLHPCTNICWSLCFHVFWVHTEGWNFWVRQPLYISLFENPPNCFPQPLYCFTFWPAVHSPHPHQHLLFSFTKKIANPPDVKWYLLVILICTYLIINADYLFRCLLATCRSTEIATSIFSPLHAFFFFKLSFHS